MAFRKGWTKIAFETMKKAGIPEEDMPEQVKDTVLAKTKKDHLGVITVKRLSGLSQNRATKTIKKFEEIVGSREDLQEKLLAVESSLSEAEKRLLKMLEHKDLKTFPRLFAEAGVQSTQVLSSYSKGCIVLGQIESAIVAQQAMPDVVRSLVQMAIAKKGMCNSCGGIGKVLKAKGYNKQPLVCPECAGKGETELTSKHFEFASEKLLELSGMMPKNGPLVNVTQQVGIKNGGGKTFFERVISTSDQVLFPRKDVTPSTEITPAPIEAEVVPSEGN